MERGGSSSQSNSQKAINKHIPISCVTNLMRPIPARLVKISGESKDYIRSCTVEFIRYVTNEANDRCTRERRRTLTAEDLKSAMSTLGFHNYVRLVTPNSHDQQILYNAAMEEHMVGGGHPHLPLGGGVEPQHGVLPVGSHGAEAVQGGEEGGEVVEDGDVDDEEAKFDPLDFLNQDSFLSDDQEETNS